MKKLLPIMTLIVLYNYVKGDTYIGFGGGCNYTHLYELRNSDDYSTYKIRSFNSYAFEINIKNTGNKILNFGMAISYISRSFYLNYSTGGLVWGNTSQGYYNSGYVSCVYLPEIAIGNKYRFFINLGPRLDILISKSVKGEGHEFVYQLNGPPITENYDLTENFNKIVVGLKGGLGLNWKLSLHTIFAIMLNYDFYSSGLLKNYPFKCTDISLIGGFCFKISKHNNPVPNNKQ